MLDPENCIIVDIGNNDTKVTAPEIDQIIMRLNMVSFIKVHVLFVGSCWNVEFVGSQKVVF